MTITRRQTLAGAAGGAAALLAGCTTDLTDSGPDYDEEYPFDVDVPEKRHGDALEYLLEAMYLTGHAPPEEAAENGSHQISGEYRSYTDDGTEATIQTDVFTDTGEVPPKDALMVAGIVSAYAHEAENPPERIHFEYYTPDADEPFERTTAPRDELEAFGEGIETNQTETTNE